MISEAERLAGRCLKSIVAPVSIGERIPQPSKDLTDLFLALERVLSGLLAEGHSWWQWHSFDGFRFPVARCIDQNAAEFLGLGLLIGDQTWTPVHLKIQASDDSEDLNWIWCRVGDAEEPARIGYGSSKENKLIHSVTTRPDDICWMWEVEHGVRR